MSATRRAAPSPTEVPVNSNGIDGSRLLAVDDAQRVHLVAVEVARLDAHDDLLRGNRRVIAKVEAPVDPLVRALLALAAVCRADKPRPVQHKDVRGVESAVKDAALQAVRALIQESMDEARRRWW